MYYELYLDSLFFMDFAMNVFLLYLVKRVGRYTVTYLQILLGAIYGAGVYCMMFFLPFGKAAFKIAVGIILSVCGMTQITFRCKTLTQFKGMSGTMISMAFFMGGISLFLQESVYFFCKVRGSVLSAVVLGAAACFLGSRMIEKGKEKQTLFCRVILQGDRQKVSVDALIDTGNSLTEPVSGKPVSVLEYETMKALFEGRLPEYYRVVPFTSIGKKKGMLKCFEIPKMWIEYQDCERVYERVLVACSEEYVCREGYRMILNPRLLKN